jgi:hypothetical protein
MHVASESVEIIVHNRFESKTLTFMCDDGGKADSDFDKHVGSFFSFDICQLVFLHNKLQTGLFCC